MSQIHFLVKVTKEIQYFLVYLYCAKAEICLLITDLHYTDALSHFTEITNKSRKKNKKLDLPTVKRKISVKKLMVMKLKLLKNLALKSQFKQFILSSQITWLV